MHSACPVLPVLTGVLWSLANELLPKARQVILSVDWALHATDIFWGCQILAANFLIECFAFLTLLYISLLFPQKTTWAELLHQTITERVICHTIQSNSELKLTSSAPLVCVLWVGEQSSCCLISALLYVLCINQLKLLTLVGLKFPCVITHFRMVVLNSMVTWAQVTRTNHLFLGANFYVT